MLFKDLLACHFVALEFAGSLPFCDLLVSRVLDLNRAANGDVFILRHVFVLKLEIIEYPSVLWEE